MGGSGVSSRELMLTASPIFDIGRNTGSRSATLVIRAMDVGDVQLKWRDLWFKLTAAVG